MSETYYTKQHLAFTATAKGFTVRITQHGLDAVGSIVYYEFSPKETFKPGDTFCTVETVKSVYDLEAPCRCRLVEYYDGDEDSITADTVIATFWGELEGDLMTADEYDTYCREEA